MAQTYDSECFELAEHFLQDERAEINTDAAKITLACAIQQAIEDEIEFMRKMTGTES